MQSKPIFGVTTCKPTYWTAFSRGRERSMTITNHTDGLL